jgi:hypothetical protein
MSQQLKNNRTTALTLPADPNVLTRDAGKEVYVVINYTAKR